MFAPMPTSPSLSLRYTDVSLLTQRPQGRHVWSALDRLLGRRVVLKGEPYDPSASTGPSQPPPLLREYERLKRLRHPRLPPVLDFHRAGAPDQPWLLYTQPFVSGEPLGALVGRLDAADLQALARQLLQLIAYLHHHRILRLDLSLDNLRHFEGELWLIDLSQAAEDGQIRRPERHGTPGFVAPEVLRSGSATERSDLYSFGALFLALAGGEAPVLPSGSVSQLASRLETAPTPDLSRLPQPLRDVVKACLRIDPDLRPPSAADALNQLCGRAHPWRGVARPPIAVLEERRAQLDALSNHMDALKARGGGHLYVRAPRGVGGSRFLGEAQEALTLRGIPHLLISSEGGSLLAQLRALTPSAGAASPPLPGVTRPLLGRLLAEALGEIAAHLQDVPVLMVDRPDALDTPEREALGALLIAPGDLGWIVVTLGEGVPPPSEREMELLPLSPKGVARWASEALGESLGPSAGLGERLWAQTEGLPRRVDHRLSAIWRGLDADIGPARSAPEAPPLGALEDTLQAEAVVLLKACSIFRGPFTPDLLSAAWPLLPPVGQGALGDLVGAGHLQAVRTQQAGLPGPAYLFGAGSLRAEASAALPESERRQGQRRLCLALLARAAKEEAPELLERAIFQDLAAGSRETHPAQIQHALQRALSEGREDDALALGRGLIERAPEEGGARAAAHITVASLFHAQGHSAAAIATLTPLPPGCVPGTLLGAKACALLARAHAQRDSAGQTLTFVQQARASSAHLSREAQLNLWALSTWALYRRGQISEARDSLDQLGEMLGIQGSTHDAPSPSREDSGDVRRAFINYWGYWAALCVKQGQGSSGAEEPLLRALDDARALGYREGVHLVLTSLYLLRLHEGDKGGALSWLRIAIDEARGRLELGQEALARSNAAALLWDGDSGDEAVEHLLRASRIHWQRGQHLGAIRTLLQIADRLIERGRRSRARESLGDAGRLLRTLDASEHTSAQFKRLSFIHALLATRLDDRTVNAGHTAARHRTLIQTLDALERDGVSIRDLRLELAADLMEMALREGSPRAAIAHFTQLSGAVGEPGADPAEWRRLHSLLAQAAATLTGPVAGTSGGESVLMGPRLGLRLSEAKGWLAHVEGLLEDAHDPAALASRLAVIAGRVLEGRALVVLYRTEVRGEDVLVGHELSVAECREISSGVVETVRRSGEAFVVGDALSHAVLSARSSITERDVQAVICLPVVGDEGAPIGALYLERSATPEPLLVACADFLRHLARILRRRLQVLLRRRRLAQLDPGFYGLVGESGPMRALRTDMARIARSRAPQLIYTVLGESGTGKSHIAEHIHRQSYLSQSRPLVEPSARTRGPRDKRIVEGEDTDGWKERFVEVNCAAIPPSLFESEVYGAAKGAATGVLPRGGYFERARNGTLFLDEFAEMPTQQQAKLLVVLRKWRFQRVGGTEWVDLPVIRVGFASNVDVLDGIREGRIREDFSYRIRDNVLRIPPLRSRGSEDILLLSQSFIAAQLKLRGAEPTPDAVHVDRFLTEEAIQTLLKHPWPGNVGELLSVFRDERIVDHLAEGGGHKIERTLLEEVLHPWGRPARGAERTDPPAPLSLPLDWDMDRLERHCEILRAAHLERVIEANGGNKTQAARQLGRSRPWLHRQLSLLRAHLREPSNGQEEGS